jgi:hypothetical protein
VQFHPQQHGRRLGEQESNVSLNAEAILAIITALLVEQFGSRLGAREALRHIPRRFARPHAK